MAWSEPWPRRRPDSSSPPGGGLFPLPPLAWEGAPSGASRQARRRARRRLAVWMETNEAIEGLNLLYGCASGAARVGHASPATPAQVSVQARLLAAVAEGRPPHVQPPPVALRELLGSTNDYEGDGNAVEEYDENRASLPSGLRAPVPLASVVERDTWELLQLDRLLADDDVSAWRAQHEPVGLYTDARLRRSPTAYRGFVRRLFDAGI